MKTASCPLFHLCLCTAPSFCLPGSPFLESTLPPQLNSQKNLQKHILRSRGHLYLFIFSIGLIMFYSSHFHRAVKIFFPLNFIFSHGRENYSCSGKREQMSAVVACAYRRIHPHAFSVNRRERSRGDCPSAL